MNTVRKIDDDNILHSEKKVNKKVSPYGEALGQRLRTRRESIGLSQKEFASKIGCAYGTYLRYELGERVPDGEFFAQVIEVTGCDPAWLLLGDAVAKPEQVDKAAETDPRMTAADRARRLFGEMTEKDVALAMELIHAVHRSGDPDRAAEAKPKYGPSKPYPPTKKD